MLLVPVALPLLVASVARVTWHVRLVALGPLEASALVFKQKLVFTLVQGQLLQNFDSIDKAVGVKSGIVLLRKSEWSAFPVGHLLALAHLLV